MNDAYVDSMGRFWIGQTADNLHPIAQLYCYEANGHCKIVESNLTISNGLDWDLQRNRFYLIDSIQKTIYVYDYNAQNGTIYNRRCFIDTSTTQGYPDGMILDSQGYLWVCFWEGSKIIRYRPDATIDISIDTPISRPTKCIFGGNFLQTLYLTSAASGVNNEEILLQPAGFTYAISVGVSGHLATLFAG